MPIRPAARRDARADGAAMPRAERLQLTGRRLVAAGFVLTVLGVVLYCAVTFAAGMSAGLGDILLRSAVPLSRGTLAILGLGTLVWLAGSLAYLRGAMEAYGEENEP